MTRAAWVVIVLAWATVVRADSLEAIGGDEPSVVELTHTIDAQIADRTATFHVERELSNPSDHVIRAELTIGLPDRAVVRGFRVLSGDRWIDGELVGAEKASDEFERLTTTGAQLAHGPAVMEWVGDGAVRVRAYPMVPGGRLRMAYTIEAPVCFAAGRWIAEFPAGADDMAALTLRTHGARVFTASQLGGELGRSVDEACAEDLPLTSDDGMRYLVTDAPARAPADTRWAHAGGVVRMSIDVAKEIAPAPHGARVVFVVDASKTMGEAGIAAQLAWARGYLTHVPDATFEIVLYRRYPERVFGRFVGAARASALIDAIDPARLRPGNGSFFDRGLDTAAALLTGPGGPRRVIAFTDEEWRPSWDAPQASAALRTLAPDAIVHFVHVYASDGAPQIDREDGDELAAVAATWGGIAASASGGAGAPRAEIAAAALVLVRPLRIDDVILHEGGDDEELQALEEGAGIYRTWKAKEQGPIFIEGKIWGRPWRRDLSSDPARDRDWAGLAIGDPVRSDLDDDAVLALATMGRVVSPLTSFLAFDRRYGAARLPDDWGEGSICGCDTIGTIGRSISTHTTCGVGTGFSIPNPEPSVIAAMLSSRVRACAAQAHQPRWDLTVGVDTTRTEVVDVQVTGSDSAAFTACVEDAAWDLELDDRFA
ncbi:MAG TPA: VIT domain-containing protein, partial [Kofleriaceae bacterium]|nr:VIT domain-containing protein [Kofleriaceae bacterium]